MKVAIDVAYQEDEGDVHGATFASEDCSLGLGLGSVLSNLEPPRLCQLLAEVVGVLRDWGKLKSNIDYYPGYRKDVQNLVDAANEISEGWAEHDRRSGI